MNPLLKKLNYKGESDVYIWNAPVQVKPLFLPSEHEPLWLTTSDALPEGGGQINFALAFVFDQPTIETIMIKLAGHLVGDTILWFAYPKKSSKRYQSAIDRDHGWQVLGQYGYEPVRQIAIDDDFSALRFRKVSYIKKLTRKETMMLSNAGKQRGVSND